MSYNTKADTVTVGETTYDIERASTDYGERLTVELDGEPVFDGLSGRIENERYIEDWMNPRADCDGILGVMLTWHPGYELGGGKHDERVREPDFDVQCPVCEGTGELTVFLLDRTEVVDPEQVGLDDWRLPDCAWCEGAGDVELHPAAWAKQVHGARVCLPLHFYEHSGITMSAGTFGQRPGYPFDCPWDAGIVGIVFDTAETRKECGWEERSDDEIEADLRNEISYYARYLEGDVRFWRVEDDETGFLEDCGGILGDDPDIEAEVFSALETAIERRLAEYAEAAHWAARDVVTV